MKKLLLIPLMIVLVSGLIFAGCAAPTPPGEAIVIRTVTFLPGDNDAVAAYWLLAEMAEKRSNGELVFEFVGGPEVMARPEMHPAAMKGVVDMIVCPTAQVVSLIPEVLAMKISEISPTEEREVGFYDLIGDRYKEYNMFYLGRASPYPFYLYTNKYVERPQDLAGLKMRTTEMYLEMMPALDIVGVSIPPSDVYTALERGTIDGFGWSGGSGVVAFGWPEVSKYMIYHPFFMSDTAFVMNLDVWNGLPKHLQDLLEDIMIELEPEEIEMFEELDRKEQQKMLDAGMEFIQFSPEDAKWYHDVIYQSCWEALKQKVSPEMYAKLSEMVSR